MAILKGIKVDEFEDVTVLVLKNISLRHKKVNDSIHIVLAEHHKTESEVMFQNTETEAICWSGQCDAIDMIIDIPSEGALDYFISYLQRLKEEHYPK